MAARSSGGFSVGGVGSGGRGGRAGGSGTTRAKSVIQLSADLDITNIEQMARKMRRAAKDTSAALTFDEKAFLKSWHKMRKEAAKEWGSAFAAATSASFSAGGLKKVFDAYETSARKIDESRIRAESLAAKLRQKGLREEEAAEIRNALAVEKKRLEGLRQRFSVETKQVKVLAERREAAAREADELMRKSWTAAAEDASSAFESHLSRLKQGEGISDILKALGRRAEVGSVQAARASGTGPGGKVMEGLSQALGKLGPFLVGVGALSAAIGVLVKMVVDADSAMKDLNRTLLESGSSAGDMAKAYEGAGEAIDRVRKSFTTGEGAFSFNRLWGTDAKDHLQILGSFAEAGLTIKEMTAGTKNAAEEMERLRQATATTLTWSKLLGKSSQEVSGEVAGYMEDLGLTLKGVSERFAAIDVAASESGFGVKRFFGQVLQATSGMSMYNVRLEEAASLLKDLGKTLGPKAGGDFLQQLTKGFGEEGIQERYRRILLAGTSNVTQVMTAGAQTAAQEFVRKLRDLGPEQAKAITEVLSGFGVDVAEQDPRKLAQQFRKLSADQRARALTKAEVGGAGDEMVRQLGSVLQLTGAKGVGGQAMALGQVGMGAKLALLLKAAAGYQGTPLHKMSEVQAMGFQQTAGISGTMFDELSALSRRFEDQNKLLGEIQKARRGGKPFDPAEAERMARTIGVYVDREGKRRRVALREGEEFTPGAGVEIGNDMISLLTSAGKELQDVAREQLPRSEQLALDVVKNTTEMTKILEQGVTYWLEQIHTVTQGIYNALGSDSERKNREKALSDLSEEMRKTHETVEESERRAAQLEVEARAAATPADRADLRTQAAEERQRSAAARGREAALKVLQKDVYAHPADWKLFWQNKTERDEFINKAIERAGPKAAEAAKKASGLAGTTEEVLRQVGVVKGVPVKKQQVSPMPDLPLSAADEAVLRSASGARQPPFSFSLPLDTGQRVPPGSEAGAGRAAPGGTKNVTVNNRFDDVGSVTRSVNRINDVVGARE